MTATNSIEKQIVLQSAKGIVNGLIERALISTDQKKEIIDAIGKAILVTEEFYNGRADRTIVANGNIAKAWQEAGAKVQAYLPNEEWGTWMYHKSRAWANPDTESEAELREHRMEISDILSDLESVRRRILR